MVTRYNLKTITKFNMIKVKKVFEYLLIRKFLESFQIKNKIQLPRVTKDPAPSP